jgi:hypothetical protein
LFVADSPETKRVVVIFAVVRSEVKVIVTSSVPAPLWMVL